jgi:hypothetical protein
VLLIVILGIEEVPLRKGFDEPSLADELGEGAAAPEPVSRR